MTEIGFIVIREATFAAVWERLDEYETVPPSISIPPNLTELTDPVVPETSVKDPQKDERTFMVLLEVNWLIDLGGSIA